MTSSTTARPTQDQESPSVSRPSQNDKEVTHSVLLHELLDPKAKARDELFAVQKSKDQSRDLLVGHWTSQSLHHLMSWASM